MASAMEERFREPVLNESETKNVVELISEESPGDDYLTVQSHTVAVQSVLYCECDGRIEGKHVHAFPCGSIEVEDVLIVIDIQHVNAK